jgi:hypothetical protein
MDTMSAMTELRRIDRESELRFEVLIGRLRGLPQQAGIALAEQLLADYNAFRV